MIEVTLDSPAAENYVAAATTVNPCKLCAPLGACLAFKGVANCIPLIHGSQGCATYIRRYSISHFREPIDIASSCFVESATVFGGAANFQTGLDNLISQYHPEVIGICTNCLSETIGEDLPRLLHDYRAARAETPLPALVPVSTPSYSGTHVDGFHAAVRALMSGLINPSLPSDPKRINLLPGFVSPADLRYLREIVADFGLTLNLLPDYADPLDGGNWEQYHKLPEGGISAAQIATVGTAAASIQCGRVLARADQRRQGGGAWLEKAHGVHCHYPGLPIGLRETDDFFAALEKVAGIPTPARHRAERCRLIDSFVDGHKYLFGKRAIVYGDEDLVVGITSLLAEIGINPVLCASGGTGDGFASSIVAVTADSRNLFPEPLHALNNVDFDRIAQMAGELKPDLLIGNSKGARLARELGVPLVRCGFPIHDRIGAARLLHLGYRGTQNLFDRIVNALIETKQNRSPLGYQYM